MPRRRVGARKQRTYRRKRQPRAAETRMRRIAKQVVMKAEETKVCVANGYITNLDMQNLYVSAPLQAVSQGTSASQRLGDEVYVRNVRCRIVFRSAGTQPHLVARVTAMWHPTNLDITSKPGFWAVNYVDKTDYLHPSLGPSTEAFVNYTGLAKPVYDKIFRVNSTAPETSEVQDRSIDFNLRINKKLKYSSSTSGLLDKQLYLVISTFAPGQAAPYVTFTGVTSDFIVTFKDA